MLARPGRKDADYVRLMLNDGFEHRIVNVLPGGASLRRLRPRLTAFHGVAHAGKTLQYRDRAGYQDILTINNDPNHPIALRLRWEAFDLAQTAFATISDEVNYPLNEPSERDRLEALVHDWHLVTTGIRLA